jgi:D-sedoheptulose 7-phosphate isomerase|tara:strand:+ start:4137 stop:4736 length:600 start_codon:yes stop_codon:yes gene_type:complete
MSYSKKHLLETKEIVERLDASQIEDLVIAIKQIKINKGRLFFLGVGGSAGNCSHAVNDFRKIIGIESYAPTDNVSELTARTNDEGWDTIFIEWLKTSQLNKKDAIFIFSVGGGSVEKNISTNLVSAINYAKDTKSKIFSIVGKNDGYAANNSHNCIVVPEVNSDSITPHSEAFQSVIWHLLVSHPELKTNETKWEQVDK